MLGSCVSHSADADGLISAFFIRERERLRGNEASVVFANYGDYLDKIKGAEGKFLYISDLGVDPENEDVFKRVLLGKVSDGVEVTYIDHHPDSEMLLQELKKEGVRVIHSSNDCAAVLTFNAFSSDLPKSYSLFAAYAAIGDHAEKGNIASKIMANTDTILAYFEASVLTMAVGEDDDIKNGLLDFMRSSPLIHLYPNVLERALHQLQKIQSFLNQKIQIRSGKNHKWAAAEVDFFTGRAASIMIQTMEIDVAIAYKLDGGEYQISLRRSDDSNVDLGLIANEAARAAMGSGGGHKQASGARVPLEHLDEFLEEISNKLRSSAVTRFCPPIFVTLT